MATTSNIGLHIYNDIQLSAAFSTVRDWRARFQGNNGSSDPSDFEIIDAAFGSVISSINQKQKTLLIFSNVVASSWIVDATYSSYGYRCDLTCSGITADSVVDVIFGLNEAISTNYAPVCQTLADIVTIYAKVSDTITIPTIKEV